MADVQKFLQQIADRRAGKIPNTKYATQRDYKTNMAASYEREKRILQHKQGVNTDNSDTSSEIKQLDVIYDDSGKVTGFEEKKQNNNRLSGSALPLAGEQMLNAQERALNKRKNNPDTVPTYEQYLMRLADTYNTQTVPSREQAQQYNADSKMLFESEMQEKYKDADYETLKNAADKTEKYQEKQWLKDKAEEVATSADLQKTIDNLTKEYEDLYNSGTDIEKDKRRDEIEKELEELEGKIKAKRNDEDKQENYSDVIQNDVKANTVLQKYYALQKAEEIKKLLKDTGANIADIKTSNAEYYNYAKNMSDDEKAQIVSDFENLKTKGYDVDKLYKYYSREQEEKLTQEQNKILSDYAGEHPVLGSAASVGLNIGGGVADAVNYIGTELDSKFNNGDGYINPESTNVYKAQLIRDTVSEDMGGLGKFLYSTGMSMADFLSTAAISAVPGGQAVGLALLGTSAGVSAANDVIESGGDIDHAVMTGIAAGIAETVFEKVSLEQLKAFKQKDVKSVKNFVMNLLKGSFTEGSEEAFTDMANAITDQIINGDMSQLSRQYSEYLASGMSEREAGWQTALNFGKQAVLDFAGGALSGAVMSGGAMGINIAGAKIDSNKSAREIGEIAMDSEEFDIDALIDSALKTDKKSKAYKMGQSMMRAKNSGNSKSLFDPVNVGILVKLTSEEYNKNGKEIQNNSDKQAQSKSNASTKNTEEKKNEVSAQPAKQEKAQTSADIKEWARKKYKFNSEEEKEEFLKLLSPFGAKNEKGLVANIRENGKKKTVMVDGIESSSRYYEDANNQITLRLTDGTVMSADDVMFHDNKFQQLVKNAAAFDTMGAQAYVRAYEDYENYAGSKADMTRYSEDFNTMYDVGRAGITYDTFIKSGQYKAIYRSIGEQAARKAIFAGNLDADYRYRDPKNKMLKVRGVKGNVVVQEGVSFDREENSEIISLLGSLSEKVGREIVITNSFDNTNIKGQFNPKTGKIYVSAEINTYEMLSITLHEAGHSIKLSAPEQWRELEKFIVNHLTLQNKNVSQMIDEQMEIYRASGQILTKETALEEIVCNSLMSLASNEKALQTAIKSTDKKALKKIADAIRKIAAKIKSFLSGRNAISAEAYKPFMNDIDTLVKLAEKFEKAAESGKGVEIEQKNNIADNSDVRNQLRSIPEEKEIAANIKAVSNMKPVATLSGSEFSKSKTDLVTQVTDYFDEIGGYVNTEYGKIELTKSGVKSSIGHGIGRNKAIAFKAVPDVLKEGKIIDFQKNWKNRGYDTAVFAAPIQIADKDYFMAAVIVVETERNSYYLHEVAIQEKEDNTLFKTGTDKNGTSGKVLSSPIFTLLQKLQSVKNESEDNTEYQSRTYELDNEYLEAINNNDLETAQKLVDEAAKENGYTKQFQDRTGSNSKPGKGIPDKLLDEFADDDGTGGIKYAIDDEYGMFDDLLEGETEEQKAERWHEEFENYLQYNPEQALLMTYNASAKTAEQAIKVYDTALDEKRVDRAIRKVWEQYHISAKNEPLGFDDFKKALNEYVADVREDKISYGESFENLVMACRDSLQFSALEDHNYDDFRAELKSICKNGLVLNKYEESEVKEIYGSVARYRNSLFGKCTVRLERNINSAGGNKTGQYIDDIIADLSNKFGDMVPVDMHSLEGLQWFEKLVNKYWQPQYVNPYIDGYSEDINTAAIQMAYDMSSAYIAEMSKQIVSNSKADKRQLREVTRLARQSQDEIKQLARAKEKAVKDKYEKELADSKERYNKRIEQLNKELDEERRNGLKRAARTEQRIYKLRKQRAELEAKNKRQRVIIKEGFAPVRDKYLEKRRATILRNRLGRMLNSLSKRLDGKANNNEYIPESLKQPILDVLSGFAVDPGKTKYGKQKAVPGYYGEYKRINEIGNAVTRLAQRYSAIDKGKSEHQDYAFIDIESLAYKESTQNALNKLSEQLEGKNIYQLDVYDLEAVVDTMELLDQTLKDAVSVIIDGQKQHITEAATKAVEEIKSVKFSKDVQRFGNSMVNNILSTPRELRNAYVATHLDPVRYGKFLSGYHEDSVTYKIFSDLHEGDKKRIRILESAMLEVQRTIAEYDDKEIKALQKNDVSEFDLRDIESGKRVKITQGVLLAIYLTDKQADGHRHMVNDQWNSYTVVPDVDYMNSPITELKGKNSSGDKFHKIRLTQSDIEQINKYIEENRLLKDLAKSISYVYNEMLPEEINAVSMAKYGKRIATVKNYYPLKVYQDGAKFSDKNFEAEFNDIRMKSRGFTKQREFSYAPIMIDDVLRTFQRHIGSVSEWCGLLIPIENFKKVYNSGNGMNTMHEAIVKKFGGSAEHYIEKLMGDLQKQRDGVDDNILVKVQQKYMSAVLMLNPGAAVKQMAAFPLANKYFGHINVTKSVVMGAVKGKELCEIYSKYTPYLWYRAQGNGTIVGETSRQAGFYGKATDALDIMGKMDRYVVNSMLYAAEQHIKKTTDLKPGTEEFYKEVARQYEKVVDESQPNNMITSKPQFIRNNVLKTLSMNAFMSQTMAMGNGLIDSFMEWRARAYDYQVNKNAESKAAKNEAGKRFLQHCIGVLESAALLSVLSLISAFGYHKWDDFKDENGNVTFDKIKKNMIDYFLDGALGSFAWGKQMYEFIASWTTGETYYGLEIMSISNINDIATDILKGNFMSLATMVGDCIGLPASNAYRIARSVTAYVNDMMYGNGNIIISNSGFNDVNLDNLPSRIVTALQSGDKDKAEYYENMLKEHLINDKGKSEKEAVDTIKNKIVSILADGDEVAEIAKLKYNGELQEYENRVNKLVAQGYDSVDVKKAVDKAISNVKADMRENDITDEESATDWLINQGFNEQAAQRISEDYLSKIDDESEEVAGALEESSENDESTKYSYDDLWNALISGNDDLYKEIYNDITTADGKLTDREDIEKKQKDANSSMKSTSRTDKLWAEYVEAVRGSEPARVKELRKIFIKIYGSWDKALEALKRYKERQSQ